MNKIFTNTEFVKRLRNCAINFPTRYQNGTIGQYRNGYFLFDCICLIKSILWGWNGDKNATYGGAKYASNGVPDQTLDWFLNQCSDVSTDFKNIEIGEYLWMNGHCGVYIGDGFAVECTPAFLNKVTITAVGNIGTQKGYGTRIWVKHGKLPYIDYSKQEEVKAEDKPVVDNTPVVDNKEDIVIDEEPITNIEENTIIENEPITDNMEKPNVLKEDTAKNKKGDNIVIIIIKYLMGLLRKLLARK